MEFRQAMTQTLAKMMQEDEKICILDADLAKPNEIGRASCRERV